MSTSNRRGRRRARRVVVGATTALALGGTALPALASTDAAPQDCGAMAPEATTTLDEVRAAVGLTDASPTGRGVTIAVIDTGVQPLAGIDQVDGPDLSFDGVTASLRGQDLHGHGTAMASIAVGDGTATGRGIAPDARVVDVKVGAGNGAVDTSQVIAAIDWVVTHKDDLGIRVLNLSYGTDGEQAWQADPVAAAAERAWHAGIVVVTSAGNRGTSRRMLTNPAHNPWLLSVGAAVQAADGTWSVPGWSSKGGRDRAPDLLAPGGHVLAAGVPGSYLASTVPSSALCTDAAGNTLLRGSGTSQAAAVVSGAAAVLLEQRPGMTPDQVKAVLAASAAPLSGADARTMDTATGGRVLDLGAALRTRAKATQSHERAHGQGSLEASRGTAHVGSGDDRLEGEVTAFGTTWDPASWWKSAVSWANSVLADDGSWTGGTWQGVSWTGDSWSGATWSGSTWNGATWNGATWSGATWSGATWSGATWSGATWSGATWAAAAWR